MIKRFGNYKADYQAGGSFDPLAPGAYVCQILGAKAEDTQWGQRLTFQVDVIEGEAAGYFQKRYQAGATSSYPTTYKGVFRLNIPTGDGTEQDTWKERAFNSTMGAIELSNPGFHFDFDQPENQFKGKLVGINVREREWEMNGNTGITTEIGAFVPVDDVREGKVRPMKRRELPNRPAAPAPMTGFTSVETDDLPF